MGKTAQVGNSDHSKKTQATKKTLQKLVGRLQEQLRLSEAEYHGLRKSMRYLLGDALLSLGRDNRTALELLRQLLQRNVSRLPVLATVLERLDDVVASTNKDRVPEPLNELVDPRSGNTIQPTRADLKIACILDEFSEYCFKYECILHPLHALHWRQQLEHHPPDLLFVESAWKGTAGSWSKKIQHAQLDPEQSLRKLVAFCRDKKIPTVFWNKEDPTNFAHFIEAAKLFDTMFTTDANAIPSYQYLLDHKRVWALPFAAQPRIHYPRSTTFNVLERWPSLAHGMCKTTPSEKL